MSEMSEHNDVQHSETTPADSSDSKPAELHELEVVTPEASTDSSQWEDLVRDAEERAIRAQAELENVRKRMRREMDDERKFACLGLMSDLLSVVDNLQRALLAAKNSDHGAGLVEGVEMVATQFVSVLERHHCKPIEAAGQPFDPNRHEAIAQLPTNDCEPGMVTDVTQVGYVLHDRVIRPAQVRVSVAKDA